MAAPAAEARLDHDRARPGLVSADRRDKPCLRVGDARAREQPGGEELVVGREERRGVVQDRDSAGRELSERLHADLDPVQGRAHVEPGECDVAGAQHRESADRIEQQPVAGAGEGDVGRAPVPGDDGVTHGASCARSGPGRQDRSPDRHQPRASR